MAFVATNKAPGVYIDEVQLPGAIAGVGTSTAAFVGPPCEAHQQACIPDQFHAVSKHLWPDYINALTIQFMSRTRCAVSSITAAPLVISCVSERRSARLSSSMDPRTPARGDALVVTAKQEGTDGNSIKVEAKDANIVKEVIATQA